MNQLKSVFISVYITLAMIAAAHSVFSLFNQTSPYQSMAWLGSALATLPQALFFMKIFLIPTPRTSSNLTPLITLAAIGAVTTLLATLLNKNALSTSTMTLPLIYALVIGLAGNLLYVFWYSRFDSRESQLLKVGNPLPTFELESANHETVNSSQFMGKPTLFMFYRGNWCPLCMAQIKEVAEQYKALAERGLEIVLISPQSHENTTSLAKKFQVPFHFLVDKDNRAAEKLQIVSKNGTPMGLNMLGYDNDTVMPTVIITDAKGNIIFADLTDNYRVRPEPATFLQILDQYS